MGEPHLKPVTAQERFLRQFPELRLGGSGIVIVSNRYSHEQSRLLNGNAGYIGDVPQGFHVGHLGHVSDVTDPSFDEFVIWDPNRVAVRIYPYYGKSDTLRVLAEEHARQKGVELVGFIVEQRPYDDRIVVLARRPRATVSPAGHTSQSIPER